MRVVREAPKVEPWQFTCPKCFTELEAEENDIRKLEKMAYDQRDGAYMVTAFFTACPVCGNRNEYKPSQRWLNVIGKDMAVTK